MEKILYKVLVTGAPISGKTIVSQKLENDLTIEGYRVYNADVDYTQNFKNIPLNTDAYILQTPHGLDAEKIDKIKFNDFNKIIYSYPNEKTYLEFLASRGNAWFKEGIADKTEDFFPHPYSLSKLQDIIKKIAYYSLNHRKTVKEDISYFKKFKNFIVVFPCIKNEKIKIKKYKSALEKIFRELKNEY